MQIDDIERFRAASYPFAIALTGGGSEFIAQYLTLPGASATFLDAAVPYSPQATDEYLGFRPESYCTEQVARQLAAKALWRAARFCPPQDKDTHEPQTKLRENLLGVGVTASLATSRPKKGAHRVHCAILSYRGVFSASLILQKDARTRHEEEHITADFILHTLLYAVERLNNLAHTNAKVDYWREYSDTLPISDYFSILPDDRAIISYAYIDQFSAHFLYDPDFYDDNSPIIQALHWHNGAPDIVQIILNNEASLSAYTQLIHNNIVQPLSSEELSVPNVLFPGSFNPPHHAHCEMVALADQILKTTVEPEISAVNVDKPPLDPIEIIRRMRALNSALPDRGAWLTNAPLYRQKAQIIPNATFVVGTDTILRLADPKYENNDVKQRDAMLQTLTERHARFLVFSRRVSNKLYDIKDLQQSLPTALTALCEFVEPNVFLDNASSTELRRKAREHKD